MVTIPRKVVLKQPPAATSQNAWNLCLEIIIMSAHNFIDLTKQTFGQLFVIKRAPNSKEGRAHWKCKCQCGKTVIVCSYSLRSGATTSCGCFNKEILKARVIDITGQKFGRLTILKQVENKNNRVYWKCHCDCGNIISVQSSDLRSGHTKSCGCLCLELAIERKTTHGMCNTPEYNVWTLMLSRCCNAKNAAFKDYGGRGITVCDEWQQNFMAFYNHIGPRPSPKHTIDRINNNGNYEPYNIRWATRYEQNNNGRNNHKITIHNWTMNLGQWAQFVGKKRQTIFSRLKKGWPPAKAIFYPILPNSRKYL